MGALALFAGCSSDNPNIDADFTVKEGMKLIQDLEGLAHDLIDSVEGIINGEDIFTGEGLGYFQTLIIVILGAIVVALILKAIVSTLNFTMNVGFVIGVLALLAVLYIWFAGR